MRRVDWREKRCDRGSGTGERGRVLWRGEGGRVLRCGVGFREWGWFEGLLLRVAVEMMAEGGMEEKTVELR